MNYKQKTQIEDINRVIRSYIRVSSKRQKEEKTSGAQTHALNTMVKREFGAGSEIQRAYIDEGYSGMNIKRPGLDALRRDLSDKSWNTLVMFSGDRLSRDFNHADKLMQEIKDAGKEIFYADGTSQGGNKFFNRVVNAANDEEREKILRRTYAGKVNRAEVDKAVNHSVGAYGYKLIAKRGSKSSSDFEQTRLEIIESEAGVVRQMFHLVGVERYTVPKLILWLKEHGIKTPKGKRDYWSTSTLYSLLKNETYIGKARFGSSEAVEPKRRLVIKNYYDEVKTSRRIKPKEEWIYIPVPAILEGKKGEELFQRVQKQLTQNRRIGATSESKREAYLFANLMSCECGYSRNGSGSAVKKNIYYTCSERKSRYPEQNCHIGGVNARVADTYLWDELTKVLTDPLELCKAVKAHYERELERDDLMDSELSMLKANIVELEKKQERIEQAYEAGAYSTQKLVTKLQPIKKHLEAAKSKLSTILPELSEDETLPKDDVLANISAYAPKALKELSFAEKREIVQEAVSKVVAVPGMATIYGSVPLQKDILLTKQHSLNSAGNKATMATNHYVYLKTISRNCWVAERWEIDVVYCAH